MSEIEIQLLTPNYYKCVPNIYSSSFEEEPWPDDWYNIPQFNKKSNWIAVVDNIAVGFIISFLSDGIPYLSVLATHDDYQGIGVGQSLIRVTLAHWKAAGFSETLVHVEPHRKKAILLYKKYGFAIVGEKDGSYELKCEL